MTRNLVRLAVFSLTVLMFSDPPAEVTAQTDRRIRLGGGAPSRVALVIGNSAYATAPLRNPVHDATDMAAVLGQLGFAVTVRTNATKEQMEAAVEAFQAQLRGGGVGVFYFAGHGVQLEGQNYLIPVGSEISSQSDVRYRTVPAGWVVGKIQESGNGLNVVILDACRNLPSFSRGWRSPAAGLASMEGSSGLLIAYATAPGQVASDGQGRNSLYAKHLLAQLQVPGQPVEAMFRAVRTAVDKDPANKKGQTPWESSSLTGAAFYFVGGPAPGGGAAAAAAGLTPAQLAALYQAAQQLNTVAAYEAVIAAAPGSPYAQLARAAIDKRRAGGAAGPPAAVASRPAAASRPSARPRELRNSLGMEFVRIEPGTFQMGSRSGEPGRDDDETLHQVTLSQPFYLGKVEVTRGEFGRFVAVTGYETGESCWTYESGQWEERPGRSWRTPGYEQSELDPVVCVSWVDAQAYVRWVSGETGETYRLPTEAEWEYAARGGRASRGYRYAGSHGLSRVGWYRENSGERTHPVGQKASNELGLYDLSGNVVEWVQDWYGDYPSGAATDPRGPSAGASPGLSRRELGQPRPLVAALRFAIGFRRAIATPILGFRLARTP